MGPLLVIAGVFAVVGVRVLNLAGKLGLVLFQSELIRLMYWLLLHIFFSNNKQDSGVLGFWGSSFRVLFSS